MRIDDFKLEHWLNPLDPICKYNLGASCVKALGVNEMLEFVGEDSHEILNQIGKMSLHYGEFDGSARLKKAIAGTYKKVKPDMVLTVHGGTGANNMVLTELLEPGDNVIVVTPSYQQHYSIPENLGIETRKLKLKIEENFLPNVEELKKIVDRNTKLISFTNPNNPAGTYIKEELMKEIIEVARAVDAYILSDEIYRGLDDEYMPSIVDLYEKGICTCSMSKVFSMAGTRVGWIVIPDAQTYTHMFNRRSYDTICGSVIDEFLSAVALENYQKLLERSKTIVRNNKKILDEWMKSQPKLQYCGKSYSSTVLIHYNYNISATELCSRIMDETGVLLCHGDCYDEPFTFRLGYGFDGKDTLVTGLKLLGEFFAKLDN